ncbi:MAG: hypothetical protein AB7P52_08665 [Alphaproteobacteria bacterium]
MSPAPAPHRDVPLAVYGFEALDAAPGWEERLCWPTMPDMLRALGDAVCRRLLALIAEEQDELARQALLVATLRMVNPFMVLAEAALIAAAEARGALAIIGGPPELAALREDAAAVQVTPDRRLGKGVLDVAAVRWARLRGLARTASWTAPHLLPFACLLPQATAVSHNALLRAYARESKARVRFAHGTNLLFEARQRTPEPALPEALRAVPAKVADALVPLVDGLAAPYPERLRRAFLARINEPYRRLAADLLRLRALPHLPRATWSGTGAAYATRLIAAEVRRRGGHVTGFDHGGVTGISQLLPLSALVELAVADGFIVGTREWARLLEHSGVAELAAPVSRAALGHAAGEPTFAAAARVATKRRTGRPRVIYVCHPYYGYRQFAIAGCRDPIYWDFQRRVVEALRRLDIELLCKPHPEGFFVGQRNPIEALAPTSYRRFEEHLGDADLFLFDAPTSTTFSEALCTDRPVVLLDRAAQYPVNPTLAPELARRCRIVPVGFDAAGRLRFDEAALEDAIAGAPEAADPGYFRALLAGI